MPIVTADIPVSIKLALVTENFFALGFALEQMRHNLRDLHRCVTEWAQSPGRVSEARIDGHADTEVSAKAPFV